MAILAIVRHGQSQWNLENRFTGEMDIDLTELGRQEAVRAGERLKDYSFVKCFTSALKRANETTDLLLKAAREENIPIIKDKALNERNYGDLQGLNKAETAIKYGEHQVEVWRRSYAVRPPGGESLQDTASRVIPYYKAVIEPCLKAGEDVLIVAHGNSLRALMMYIEDITPEEIEHVNIATGVPRVYSFETDGTLREVHNL